MGNVNDKTILINAQELYDRYCVEEAIICINDVNEFYKNHPPPYKFLQDPETSWLGSPVKYYVVAENIIYEVPQQKWLLLKEN